MSIKMLTTFPDPRKSVIMKPDPTRIDPLKLKLGKKPARHDPRTLLFATCHRSSACSASQPRPYCQDESPLGHDGQCPDRRLHLRCRRAPPHGVDRQRPIA